MRLLLAALAANAAVGQLPVVYRTTEPAAPNDTVIVSGFSLQQANFTLSDAAGAVFVLPALLPTANAVKVVIPTNAAVGVYQLNVSSAAGEATVLTLNAPAVDWFLSEAAGQSSIAVIGTTLHLYGKNLIFDGTTGECLTLGARVGSVLAVPVAPGPNVSLALGLSSCYRLDLITAGAPLVASAAYDLFVSNGLLPAAPLRVLAGLVFVGPSTPPPGVFTVNLTAGCTRVSSCILTATAAGGGSVIVPAGTWYMDSGEVLAFPGGAGAVTVVGAGAESTAIVWTVGTGLPKSPQNPISGNGTWGFADITLTMLAAPQPGAQPAQGLDFIVVGPSSSGVRFERVAIVHDQSAYPGIQIGNALAASSTPFLAVVDSTLYHTGNCASQWPHCATFYAANVSDMQFTGNTVTSGCPGYSRLHFADSAYASVGPVSQGSGFNTLAYPEVLEHVYFGNNTDSGNPSAPERWEAMTFDGGGGQYNGTALNATNNPDGTQTLLLEAPVKCFGAGNWACLPKGLTVAIMRGTGTGQIRRLVSVAPGAFDTVTVDAPFDPAPVPGDSYLSIVQYRGKATFESNTYTNGTCFQFYGAATDCVVSNNTFTEMFTTSGFNATHVAAGLRFFGHRYMFGYEPTWYNVIEKNALTCTTQFIAYSDAIDNVVFSLSESIRKNSVAGGVDLGLNLIWDCVAEHNSFAAAYCAYAGAELPAGSTQSNTSSPGTLVR